MFVCLVYTAVFQITVVYISNIYKFLYTYLTLKKVGNCCNNGGYFGRFIDVLV